MKAGAVEDEVVRNDDGDDTCVSSAPRTLADIVTHAVSRFPDRPALATPDGDLTFAEIDADVASLAHGFASSGVEPGDLVAVSMHKTSESFLIIHALLRVGAVFVPLDPLMPVSVAVALVDRLRPAAMVVDRATLQRLDPFGGDVGGPGLTVFTTDIEDDRAASVSRLMAEHATSDHDRRSLPTVQPEDPAYVIFTSGSTGTPKGITHTHRSGLAYAELAVVEHDIQPDDRVAGMPPLHFDMSTLELYAAPLAGAASVPIGSADLRFPATFTERSEAERLTLWYAVPFQLRLISERGAIDQRDLSDLRHVIYAGEAFSAPALSQLMHQLPGVQFSNAYGPAETNVCTLHRLAGPPSNAVPIGQPWGDVEVRIVDPEVDVASADDLVDMVDGELGELWVSAPTTMAGYHGRPDLTAERMLEDDRSRWYRTGDLVRRSGGVLWLAGRVDHQVKVRGVRLELEAIEAVLAANGDVVEAVVAPVVADPVDHLTAAVVLSADVDALDLASLRRWCLARLPQVAVPIDVETWDAFPLTSSGKIDRASVRRSLAHPASVTADPANDVVTTQDN